MSSPEKLNSILDSFLSSRGYLSYLKENAVISHWNEIVGENLSSVTFCENVEDGILYVRVQSSTWRQELSFFKKEILSKIPSITNCHTITDIVFL